MRHVALFIAALLVTLSSFAERRPGTISGQVLYDDSPLPGTTVRLLEGGSSLEETTTDVNGRYRFDVVPGGYYDLEVSLDGLVPAKREVYVNGGLASVEPVSLELEAFETITVSCGSPCDGEGEPTCEEYEINRGLEDSAARDSRVIAQLRERYRLTSSREERARIGGFLVGVLDHDDEEYLAPLATATETLLSLAERSGEELDTGTPEYVAWCESTGRDVGDELWMLEREAFALFGSADSRVVDFAHRALRANEPALLYAAIAYTSLTCDASLLAAFDDDFSALEETLGASGFADLMPCGDPVLNERIVALDPKEVETLLPHVVEARDKELGRLGKATVRE